MIYIAWVGIVLCLSQSAILSGANLAFFSVSKMRLELEANNGNEKAIKVMKFRNQSNFLLVTILWANVSINVLLALLSQSVMAGVLAFLFSTVLITIVGEILPQAYFSRRALAVSAYLSPIIRFYQIVLYPIAFPTAWVLNRWLGEEVINYYNEKDIEALIEMHMKVKNTEINRVEGIGTLNFLSMDDLPLFLEGEELALGSIIKITFNEETPVFPKVSSEEYNSLVEKILLFEYKWMVLVDQDDNPKQVLNTHKLARLSLLDKQKNIFLDTCHIPIIIKDKDITLGTVLPKFTVYKEHNQDDVIDEDVIILWSEVKRIITGSDILGRLLRRIVKTDYKRDKK